MVRKSVIICLAVCVILAVPVYANADQVYKDGNISTSFLTYFSDLSSKISPIDDYVFFRSGQYEYKLVAGDLDYESGYFYGSDVKSFTLSTSNAYSPGYIWTSEALDFFDLTTDGYMVYSNLGSYPDLMERGDSYAFATLLLLVVVLCCYLFRSIFGFSLRSRN